MPHALFWCGVDAVSLHHHITVVNTELYKDFPFLYIKKAIIEPIKKIMRINTFIVICPIPDQDVESVSWKKNHRFQPELLLQSSSTGESFKN